MREILRQGVVVKADREDRFGPGFGHGSALVVGWQRPEVVLEFSGVESLLAVTGEDRLDGGIAALHRLKRSQRRINPLLWQVVQQGVGFLSGRHNRKW
jgi:hypothetical protein